MIPAEERKEPAVILEIEDLVTVMVVEPMPIAQRHQLIVEDMHCSQSASMKKGGMKDAKTNN